MNEEAAPDDRSIDAASWPQPPPPPSTAPQPPPPPAAIGTYGAGAIAPGWAPGAGLAWPPTGSWPSTSYMPPELVRVPGRGLLVLLGWVSAIGALAVLPELASGLRSTIRTVVASDAVAGGGAVAGAPAVVGPWVSDGLVVGALLVALLTVVAIVAAWRWLRGVGSLTGAGSPRAVLRAQEVAAPCAGAAPEAIAAPAAPSAFLQPPQERVPGAIRSSAVAATLAGLGAIALGVGAGALRSVGGTRTGVLASVVAISGAAAIVMAAGLLPSVLRAVDRRLIGAAQARQSLRVALPVARSPLPGILTAAALVAMVTLPTGGDLAPGIAAAGGCDLPDPWECWTVTVATDMDAGPGAGIVKVRFAIAPAVHPDPVKGRRVLVLVDGGPGASGIEDADWMRESLAPRLLDRFDVVAFDARGTGGTDAHECRRAGRAFTTAPLTEHASRGFVTDCLREVDLGGQDLRRFGSRQIAADIDSIRVALGVQRLTLYGQSYGTVIAQEYAAMHPDRLDGLVLDAPIDRSLPGPVMWAVAARGFDTSVAATLDACALDAACKAALPDPRHTVERVYQQLGDRGVMSDAVTQPDGRATREQMTTEDYEAVQYSAMYDISHRMNLLRALAAIDHGDRRQLLRLLDVEGGAARPFDFSYYATWCADVRASPGAKDEDFQGYLDVARTQGITADAPLDIAWTIAPCVFWPAQPTAFVAPLEATTVPTLILSATTDPITPVSEARAILGRHAEARLIETKGGAHGSLGDDCPMERVAEFVTDGRLPVAPTSICPGEVIAPYIPIARSPAASASDAALGVYDELVGAPEVLVWDGLDSLALGCADGGTARLSAVDGNGRSDVIFTHCAWASRATFDGSGWIDLYTSDAFLELCADRGSITLDGVSDGWRVSGTWDGRRVDERP